MVPLTIFNSTFSLRMSKSTSMSLLPVSSNRSRCWQFLKVSLLSFVPVLSVNLRRLSHKVKTWTPCVNRWALLAQFMKWKGVSCSAHIYFLHKRFKHPYRFRYVFASFHMVREFFFSNHTHKKCNSTCKFWKRGTAKNAVKFMCETPCMRLLHACYHPIFRPSSQTCMHLVHACTRI